MMKSIALTSELLGYGRRHEAALRRALFASTALVGIALVSPATAQSTKGGSGGADYFQGAGTPVPAGGTSGVAGTDADDFNPYYYSSKGGAGGGAGASGGNALNSSGTVVANSGGAGGSAGMAGSSGTQVVNYSYRNSGSSAGGGGGGDGAIMVGTGITAVTTGGDGGAGADNTYLGGGGGGGAGGAGINEAGATNFTVIVNVTGGVGGGGGQSQYGSGGGGGDGGSGIVVTAAPSITIESGATVRGGNGGAGGAAYTGYNNVTGDGGAGGVGVFTSGTLTNAGTIIGGLGGAAGTPSAYSYDSNYSHGAAGADGAGVVGANLVIVNTGTISGGGTADAITFTGGDNALVLGSGGVQGTLNGTIGVAGSLSIDSGASAGGSATLGNDIHGTGSVTAVGAGSLTFAGALSESGGFNISDGSDVIIASTGSYRADPAINLGVATLTNLGSISTTGPVGGTQGVVVAAGATINNGDATNVGASLIGQDTGIAVFNGTGVTTINNAGLIKGLHYEGVTVRAGSLILNNASTGVIYGQGQLAGSGWAVGSDAGDQMAITNTGTIVGANYGVFSTNANDAIVNSGTIASGSYDTTTGVITSGGISAITLNSGGQITNQTTGVIYGGPNALVADATLVLSNAGSISASSDAVLAGGANSSILNTGSIKSINNSAITATSGAAITNASGATLTGGTDATYGYAVQLAGNGGTFDNYGTATGSGGGLTSNDNLSDGGAGVTVNLFAGSTTGAINLAGNSTNAVSLYSGAVTTGPDTVIDPVNGMSVTVRAAGTYAAAVYGPINLGANGNNTLNLTGGGDDTMENGASASFDLSTVSGANTIAKTGTGTWTLTGVASDPTTTAATILAGNGTPSGLLVFDGATGLTGDIYVNGATIRATTAGGFGTGTIYEQDPTTQFGASGTYANNIVLQSTDVGADPTVLETYGAQVVATLSGAITQTGAEAQAVTFGSVDATNTPVAGTFILTNTGNAWNGATTIDSGTTLQGATDTISGDNIVDNGTIDYDQSLDGIVAKAISGTGSFVKNGMGNVTLSAANTFSGSTTINAGTLSLAGGSAIASSGSVSVNAGATLNLLDDETITSLNGAGAVTLGANTLFLGTNDSSSTLSGIVSGAGGITQIGSGTLTLSGINTYTGTTLIDGGAFVLGASNALAEASTLSLNNAIGDIGANTDTVAAFNLTNSALNGTGTLTAAIYSLSNGVVNANLGAGALTQVSGTTTLNGTSAAETVAISGGTLLLGASDRLANTAALTLAASGTFDLASFNQTVAQLNGSGVIALGSGTLTVAQNVETDYAGSISGAGGLIKSGTGNLVLSGASTYTGATLVSDGILSVNGQIASAVTISGTGRLGGNGQVGGVTISSGATLAPGNSIGTLNINGNLTIAAGAYYAVDVSPTAADRVNVTGTVTLQGGTVQVLATGAAYAPTTSYTILSATGGVSGKFAALTSNYAFLTPTLEYAPTTVALVLLRNDATFSSVAQTPNQLAVASAIQGVPASGLSNVILPLTAPNARQAFDALSGEIYASVPSALIEEGSKVRDALLLDGRRTSEGFGIWGDLVDNTGQFDARPNTGTAKLDTLRKGIIAGINYGRDGFRGSIASGYSEGTYRMGARGSNADVNSYYAGAQAGYTMGRFRAQIGGAYSWHDIYTSRDVDFTGLTETVKSSQKGHTVQGFGEIGYALFDGPTFRLEPFAGYTHLRLRIGGAQESAGLSALTVARVTRDVDYSTAGVHLSAKVPFDGTRATFEPRLTVAWQHGWGDLAGTATSSFAGSSPFTVTGSALPGDAIKIHSGFDLSFGAVRLGAAYVVNAGAHQADHGAKVTMGIQF
ncbi:hypothetical protein D3Y57_12050 [Sphingomonas paeninsulae]|uniref:Autotransporter domain-containing protein n=1 Tax=Sphingomonas paeninsulae TaxID=2319844 RepID=A0A494TB17_SPHPE|nr:autotransporter-associated beta strand repeat-containing protein [Sphingomonas paeninsulae]AYJ86567.1 hypothetical protein D3Y57_12050 [Sphingomonas paeninsulae]